MKFVKSSFAQKLIIVLVAIMIFNIAVPQEAKAWDLAGILFKPVSSLILGVLISVDVTIGLTLTGISAALDVVGIIVNAISKDERSSCGKCRCCDFKTVYRSRYNIFWRSYYVRC